MKEVSIMKLTSVSIVLAIFALVSVAHAGVKVDYDTQVDFTEFGSFGWMKGTPAPNELVQKRIESAVESELAARGLSPAADDADLLVVTHASVSKQLRIDADTWGYRGRWRGGWGTTTVNVSEIPVGTLVVDLVDAGSNELVWRGIASETIASNPEKSEKRINKVVRKLFKKFPPSAE
jgi:hypothetical protein